MAQPISIKIRILAAVLLMATVAAGGALYASAAMTTIGSQYGALLDHDEVGLLQSSRFSRFVVSQAYSVYKLMEAKGSVQDGDYAKMLQKAKADYDENKAKTLDTLTVARRHLPGFGAELDQTAADYRAVSEKLDSALDLVMKDDITDATVVMADADAKITAMTAANGARIAALTDRIQAKAAALATDTAATGRTTLAIITAAAVLVGFGAMLMAGRTITGPLNALRDAMARLARGELDVAVPGLGRRDEVGQMAGTVGVFRDNALRARALEAEAGEARRAADAERARAEADRAEAAHQQAEVVGAIADGLDRLAHGDLVSRLDRAFSPEYEKLRGDFNGALAQLQQTLAVVAQNGGAIRSGTGEISTAADDLSRRTEQQAASLEETAAALDEITATVRKTAEGARHADAAVRKAKAGAEDSGRVVRQAVEAMNG
ncbi:methyl-accepting chemotaxis protein, partial [Lichenibacterium ramalinae]